MSTKQFIDPYSIDNAEQKLLQSKPVSFLFVGKRRVGKSSCAKYLSNDWGAKLISEVELINNELETEESEYGDKINELLRDGKAVGKEIISALYMKALKSEAAEHYGVVVDGIPDIENVELLDEILSRTNVVLNMKIQDNDHIYSRQAMGYDPMTGKNISFLNETLAPVENKIDPDLFDEEAEEIEEAQSSEDSFDPENLVKNCSWITIPEDLEPHLTTSAEEYENKYMKAIEDILINVHKRHKGEVIELFCLMGYSSDDINTQMMRKINCLDLPRAMVPILLQSDEDAPEELATEELAESWIRKLREVNKPAPRFRWKRSRWGRYCPIALASGYITTGMPQLALSFLGKMYFFSSQERMDDFKINPRKYLVPSEPRNPIRIAVTGHPTAGKSTLVKELAEYYKCEIINPHELVAQELLKEEQTSHEKKRAECTELALAMIQTQLGEEQTIDMNDPRVQETIEEQMKLKESEKVTLPPSVYVEKIEAKINEIEEARRVTGEMVPVGRWVIDGFPLSKEDWNAMVDNDLVPYDLIVVRDQTEKFENIIEKHYQDNKEKFDREFTTRMRDEMKQKAENEAEGVPTVNEPTSQPTRPLFSSPEFDKFRSMIGQLDAQLTQLTSQAQQQLNMNLFQVKYTYGESENMSEEAIKSIEARFKIQAWPWTGQDQQEEEDDAVPDEEGEEEEAQKSPNQKRLWGASSFYDPVLLSTTNVIIPGIQEVLAKYDECTYTFQNTETCDAFIENPEEYINLNNGPTIPPPMRLCVIGTRGSGKTTQVERIATDNNTYHLSFRDLVQEKLLDITKGNKVGAEYVEFNRLTEERVLSDKTNLQTALAKIVYPPEESEKEASQEGEDSPKVEASEREMAYQSFLQSNESIPHEFLDGLLRPFWKDEKYNNGFIMEGFPSSPDDVRYMVASGLYPDTCLLLNCSEKHITRRNLPKRIEYFCEYFQLKKERLAQIRTRKEQIRLDYIKNEVKRQLDEQEAQEDQGHLMSEEEIRGNIESYFLEDFLEVEDPYPESIEEAEERIRMEIQEDYSIQQEQINNVLELLEEAQIPRLQVDSTRKIHQVHEKSLKLIEPYLKPCRFSMFERVVPISYSQADNLLRSNYLKLSSFGRWDPVQLKEGNVFKPLDEDTDRIYPLAYGPYVYFCYTPESRNKFVKTPLEYIGKGNATPPPPKALSVAIIGPPRSGKSTLAKRFAAELGLMKLSPIDIVELLLSKYSKSIVAQQMQAQLINGEAVPNTLLYNGLDLVIMNDRCRTRGFVLDGIPATKEEFDILQRRSIVPFRIIELDTTFEDVKMRNSKILEEKILFKEHLELIGLIQNDEEEEEEEEENEEDGDGDSPRPLKSSNVMPIEEEYQITDSDTILKENYEIYTNQIREVKQSYSELYRNWKYINAKQNRWKMWNELFNFVSESFFKLQRYMINIKNGSIAQLDGICITPHEFETRKGDFKDYCPVSFVLRDELVDCKEQIGMRLCLEWRRRYYRVAGSREMDLILSDPERFLNENINLPKHLPKSITPEESHEWLKTRGPAEIKAFCPVRYKDSDCSYDGLVPGSENIAAIYQDKLYVFVSEENKCKFMLHPDRYINLVLPSKLPPKPVHIPFTSLPTGGYLEQGIAELVISAIDSVGRKKPKFPFTTITQSALLFVSIFLKANNPKMTDYTRSKWTDILDEFNNDCDNISFLGRKMTRRYRAPSKRLPELDTRLARFFNLKQKPEYMRLVFN